MKFFSILLVLLSLNGCAVGNKISYDGASDLSPTFEKDIPILILMHDIRPYVLSGDKKTSFVGLTRSLYGIPYATNTLSGKSLAVDACTYKS